MHINISNGKDALKLVMKKGKKTNLLLLIINFFLWYTKHEYILDEKNILQMACLDEK